MNLAPRAYCLWITLSNTPYPAPDSVLFRDVGRAKATVTILCRFNQNRMRDQQKEEHFDWLWETARAVRGRNLWPT